VLQLKDLRVGQWDKSCIGLTQENSIENSVQDCLPYISKTNGSCFTTLAHSKWPFVCLKVNIYNTLYDIIPFRIFYHLLLWYVIMWHYTNPNPKFLK